jgi:glucan 1,3-beta-glucosidase
VTATGQGLRFEGVTAGVDTTGNTIDHFNLINSSASNTQAVLSAHTTTRTMQGSLPLENVIVDSTVPVVSQNHDHP